MNRIGQFNFHRAEVEIKLGIEEEALTRIMEIEQETYGHLALERTRMDFSWGLTAWSNNRPVGFVLCVQGEGILFAQSFAVSPSFRRQGIGTRLLEVLLCMPYLLDDITATCIPVAMAKHHESIRFLEKRGFKLRLTWPTFRRKRVRGALMVRRNPLPANTSYHPRNRLLQYWKEL